VSVHHNQRVPGSQSKLEFAKDVYWHLTLLPLVWTGVDWLLERTVDTGSTGVSFGPHSFSDLDFADDVALLAELLELLVPALETMASEAASFGLELNWQKTKVQALGSMDDILSSVTVLGQEVAMVEEFVYLGSLVHSSTQSSPDTSRRNAITRVSMQNLDKQRYHHVRNDEVRRTTGQPRRSAIVRARRLSVFGHTARMPDETDARNIVTVSLSENWRKSPRRPRTTWMKTIQQDLRSNYLSLDEAITVAQNRPLWRLMSAFGATHPSGVCHTRRRRRIQVSGYIVMCGKILSICSLLLSVF